MPFRVLRRATVWLPVLFIVILEIAGDFVLELILGRWLVASSPSPSLASAPWSCPLLFSGLSNRQKAGLQQRNVPLKSHKALAGRSQAINPNRGGWPKKGNSPL